MAKRKRTKQNKPTKKTPKLVTEFSNLPPEVMESDTRPDYVTFEEAQKNESKFETWRQQTLDWIKEESAKLEGILLQYNPFDLIGNLTITQLFINPEKHNMASHRGLPAIVEYATLLYLKHPFSERPPLPIGQVPLEEIDTISRSIQLATALYYGSDEMRTLQKKQRDAIDALRFRTMLYEMTVRSPGYEHHQRETLLGLFEGFKDWMMANLGFDVLDLFAVEVPGFMMMNLRDWWQSYHHRESPRLPPNNSTVVFSWVRTNLLRLEADSLPHYNSVFHYL